MGDDVDDKAFIVEEVVGIIEETIKNILGDNRTNTGLFDQKVGPWTSSIVESCLGKLAALHKPFKYIVTCLIMQRTGAGLIKASACFWDRCTDGACTIR